MNPSSHTNNLDTSPPDVTRAAPPDSSARADIPAAVVQYAAQRAHDLADSLHGMAKERIEKAQQFANDWAGGAVMRHAQPRLLGAGNFVRQHPLRTVLMLALIAGAVMLGRSRSNASSFTGP